MLAGKKILIGVTGSIAAYKIILLVRLLTKQGAEVKVVITASAAQFVSPLTLSTLTKNEVLQDLSSNDSWANHVMLGRWADLMLIAPLSCNTLAKMAAGSCDNLLMAVYLSATCPVMVAPAMDEDMWLHPATQRNLGTVASYGNIVIPVASGELASGLVGPGRMAEPEFILETIQQFFQPNEALKGKKVLITAGPTYEAIDPVRFISNHSTGKMGIALANAFKKCGASVCLVLGPSSEKVPEHIEIIRVQSAEDMYQACVSRFDQVDIAVMSAAVADYTPVEVAAQKIKKAGEESLTIELAKTKDILRELGSRKQLHQKLIGFALETHQEEAHALKKLYEKNADAIVLNSLNDPGAGFGHLTNKITIFDRAGNVHRFDTKSKAAVAEDIVNTIIQL